MTTECSSTADAITGVLMAGDAVLNLSQQPLNAIAGTLFVAAHEDQLSISRQAGHLCSGDRHGRFAEEASMRRS